MVIKYLASNRIIGLSTDTKPTHPQANSTFFETDTMSLFLWNGSTWLREEDQPETFSNKTMDSISNTFQNLLVSPFAQNFKRFGGLIPGSTASGGLYGTLGGWPTNGTFTTVDDATEGTVNRFSSSSNGAVIGYLSNAAAELIAQRSWNPSIKVKVKVSTTTDSRLYIGFSSNNTLPSSDTILGNTEHGVLVGFDTSASDFSVYNNDGSGAMVTTSLAVAKDTSWHTFEITLVSNGNATVKLDGNATTISTRLPNNTTVIYGNVVMELAAASAMSVDIKGIQFTADK